MELHASLITTINILLALINFNNACHKWPAITWHHYHKCPGSNWKEVNPKGWMTYHYYKIFITAGSKPLTPPVFAPSAVKVIGDKNGHHLLPMCLWRQIIAVRRGRWWRPSSQSVCQGESLWFAEDVSEDPPAKVFAEASHYGPQECWRRPSCKVLAEDSCWFTKDVGEDPPAKVCAETCRCGSLRCWQSPSWRSVCRGEPL